MFVKPRQVLYWPNFGPDEEEYDIEATKVNFTTRD
jgi:hypothetical protein